MDQEPDGGHGRLVGVNRGKAAEGHGWQNFSAGGRGIMAFAGGKSGSHYGRIRKRPGWFRRGEEKKGL